MDNLTICDRCGSDACYVQEVNQDSSDNDDIIDQSNE